MLEQWLFGAQLQELILSQLVYNLLSHSGAQTVTKCLPLPWPSNPVLGMVNHSLCPGSDGDTLNPPLHSPTAPSNHKVPALSPPKDFFLESVSFAPLWSRLRHLISSHLIHISSQHDGILSASISLLLLWLPFNLWRPRVLQSLGSLSQTQLHDWTTITCASWNSPSELLINADHVTSPFKTAPWIPMALLVRIKASPVVLRPFLVHLHLSLWLRTQLPEL